MNGIIKRKKAYEWNCKKDYTHNAEIDIKSSTISVKYTTLLSETSLVATRIVCD